LAQTSLCYLTVCQQDWQATHLLYWIMRDISFDTLRTGLSPRVGLENLNYRSIPKLQIVKPPVGRTLPVASRVEPCSPIILGQTHRSAPTLKP